MKVHSFIVVMVLTLTSIFAGWCDTGRLIPVVENQIGLQSEGVSVNLGGTLRESCVKITFPMDSKEILHLDPAISRRVHGKRVLSYEVVSPRGNTLTLEWHFQESLDRKGIFQKVSFFLTPSQPLVEDIQVEIPFQIKAIPSSSFCQNGKDNSPTVTWPLKNGWAKETDVSKEVAQGEYRLGHAMTGKDTQELALPMLFIGADNWKAGLFTDPEFSVLFSIQEAERIIKGSLVFHYVCTEVPVWGTESRMFAVWITRQAESSCSFPDCLDAWFSLMLPVVPPGPDWLHEIAMVGYDYLSDEGKGWEKDITVLAGELSLHERRRVALCLHGWYDALGVYCYDSTHNRIKSEWTAFERTRKVHFTQMELRRRLRLARSLGFRVLLYFGDGLAADSGVPGYRDDWAFRDTKGERISGWQGPDTFGPTYLRNPSHPEVRQWYQGYLSALLDAFGESVDGFVWDETFHARAGQIAHEPEPAYCDRAMFTLVKDLTQQVENYNPEKVFLASDCTGLNGGWEDVPGYAMVADGTYQDTHCFPVAWSYGFFPNWRNVLWSCNWSSLSGFDKTQWGVRTFGVPVAISNGWGDDRGPSEWTPAERDKILQLFREHVANIKPARYLTVDPACLLSQAP